MAVTIECAENPAGGGLVSHAEWTGVALADVLGQAGPLREGRFVRLTGEDGFVRNIQLEKASWPGVLLATSALAYCHGGLEQGPYAFTAWFLVGSVFAGLYLWRKSLLPGILTHYLADASLLLM